MPGWAPSNVDQSRGVRGGVSCLIKSSIITWRLSTHLWVMPLTGPNGACVSFTPEGYKFHSRWRIISKLIQRTGRPQDPKFICNILGILLFNKFAKLFKIFALWHGFLRVDLRGVYLFFNQNNALWFLTPAKVLWSPWLNNKLQLQWNFKKILMCQSTDWSQFESFWFHRDFDLSKLIGQAQSQRAFWPRDFNHKATYKRKGSSSAFLYFIMFYHVCLKSDF